MLLCDSCPRGFHMACLELDYDQLTTGEWACPKCAAGEAKAAKREARAANKDKCVPFFNCSSCLSMHSTHESVAPIAL